MTAGATETLSSPMNSLPEGRPTPSIVSVMFGLVATKSETECAPHVSGDCGGFGERLTDRVDGDAGLDRSVTVVAAVDAGAVAQTQIHRERVGLADGQSVQHLRKALRESGVHVADEVDEIGADGCGEVVGGRSLQHGDSPPTMVNPVRVVDALVSGAPPSPANAPVNVSKLAFGTICAEAPVARNGRCQDSNP